MRSRHEFMAAAAGLTASVLGDFEAREDLPKLRGHRVPDDHGSMHRVDQGISHRACFSIDQMVEKMRQGFGK
jgi:hypothetical protein